MGSQTPGLGTTQLVDVGTDKIELILETLQLIVRAGPAKGRRLSLALPRIRLGSAEDNDLVLDDPTISRHHAELTVQGGTVKVKDLGSTNGTFVGPAKITEAEVPAGTRVRLGDSEIEVTLREQKKPGRIGEEDRLGELVGGSETMRRLYAKLKAVAPTPVTVLLLGESGTGKEVVAHTIHERSNRKGSFVVFDAAATDPEMIRSQLFGHIKGAFTGASADRDGAFRKANGGTLFIDELGELPLDLQPRLLRALERREVAPVGSDEPRPVDVRVIAATNRNLEDMVAAGTFREDLYHRLSVIPLRLPPLRDRAGDLPLLVEHLLEVDGLAIDFSEAAMAAIQSHSWPGNVRALRNVLQRVAVLCAGRQVTVEDLELPGSGTATSESPRPSAAPAAASAPEGKTLAEVEKKMIFDALERHGGDKAAAAVELGISESTLRRRLKEYGG